MCREERFWSKTHLIMCLSAHNYLTFGSGRHIITRVLDQSTLKNLQRKPRTFFSHIITSDLDCFWEVSYSAWKVQRICVCATESLTKSGKSTDSLMLLGKSYRFFEEIRRKRVRRKRVRRKWVRHKRIRRKPVRRKQKVRPRKNPPT